MGIQLATQRAISSTHVRILPSDTCISGSARSKMHWLMLSLPESISVVSIRDSSDPFLVGHSIIILKHPTSSPSIIIINCISRHGQGTLVASNGYHKLQASACQPVCIQPQNFMRSISLVFPMFFIHLMPGPFS